MQLSILLAVAAVLAHTAHAHISLSFPPARSPDYDFLDNVRTGGPCGVPGELVSAAAACKPSIFKQIYMQGLHNFAAIIDFFLFPAPSDHSGWSSHYVQSWDDH